MSVRVCVFGCLGRMGRAVQEAALARDGITMSAAIDRGDDIAGGFAEADAYIDFTTPDATRDAARIARERKIAAVIGTTGLTPDAEEAIGELAKVAPVVVAANFSLGVNVVLGVVRQVARVLGPDWDAEVVETHHNKKRDAPSGTALAIAKAIAAGHGVDYDKVKRHSRDGEIGPRPRGEIGVSTVRGGDVIGEHVATFFGAAERVEIAHRATSRTIFAAGAVTAAHWVVGKPPGRYDMQHVLGFAS